MSITFWFFIQWLFVLKDLWHTYNFNKWGWDKSSKSKGRNRGEMAVCWCTGSNSKIQHCQDVKVASLGVGNNCTVCKHSISRDVFVLRCVGIHNIKMTRNKRRFQMMSLNLRSTPWRSNFPVDQTHDSSGLNSLYSSDLSLITHSPAVHSHPTSTLHSSVTSHYQMKYLICDFFSYDQ